MPVGRQEAERPRAPRPAGLADLGAAVRQQVCVLLHKPDNLSFSPSTHMKQLKSCSLTMDLLWYIYICTQNTREPLSKIQCLLG